MATLLFVELVTQWVHMTFFLVPNIYELACPCHFFSPVIGERTSGLCAVPNQAPPNDLE